MLLLKTINSMEASNYSSSKFYIKSTLKCPFIIALHNFTEILDRQFSLSIQRNIKSYEGATE